ncbi:MAG: membrane integrity-associated transporter subunit PqiC [Desulfobacula sp.]|nr:membrane integrity-associated transporter subunit PqiC [Desulfobacula sp.]
MIKRYLQMAGLYGTNNFYSQLLNTLCIFLLSGFFLGCIGGTSPKSLHYVFSSSHKLSTAKSFTDDYSLGVGPIKIPQFLERPQIVTRQEQNLLNINEFHRWGDSLEAQITNVLVENLSTLLNTPKVITYPWTRPFSPDYQLYIDFRRFDGNPEDSVIMDAIWRVVDTKNNKNLLTKRTSQIVPTNGKGYKSYVAALNTALEKLSQQIAHNILLMYK